VPSGYTRISPINRPEYRDLISSVSEAVWPEFMFHDPIAALHWGGLFAKFPAFRFALLDQESDRSSPPPPPTEEALERFLATASKYGLETLLPGR